MIDEKTWNDFQISCEIYKNKIDNLEKRVYNHEERIAVIEKENTKTDLQYTQIMEKLNKLIDTTIPALSAEIQAIKEKPAKRYETVIAAILGAIGGGIGTSIVTFLIK
jgi:CII-binding regulator of phage lambda lysogenization HflD